MPPPASCINCLCIGVIGRGSNITTLISKQSGESINTKSAMSDPRPTKRRRNEEDNGEASQHNEESAEPSEVTFVYTGQPTREIPRDITQLLVDPSVRRIEYQAFMNCKQLKSITIPSTVEVIGDRAFFACVSLTDVHLHKGLKSIGTCAFHICTSLTNVRLPEGLQTIGEDAFADCASLSEMELPNGITEIADSTFDCCRSLRTVSIPITVKRIGWHAFADCISLLDVSLPTHLKLIESHAFIQCNALSSVALPSSLEVVGSGAFSCCKSLLSVEFPQSSSNLRSSRDCFNYCKSLVNVSIPISSEIAFSGCPIPKDKRDCLKARFANHPVHSLCYESSTATRDQMMRVLHGTSDDLLLDDSMLKDAFDMTPFHVLATSAGLNQEILECLLERYTMDILGYKDLYGNTMMDYLLKHTSPRAVPLLQIVLRRAIVDTISTWYPQGNWGTNLSMMVEAIPYNSDMVGRRQCVKDFLRQVGYCSRVEITSAMELAVWKTKMRSMEDLESNSGGDICRDSFRYQSGSGIVIENVFGYLWHGESTSGTALSLFPTWSSTSI